MAAEREGESMEQLEKSIQGLLNDTRAAEKTTMATNRRDKLEIIQQLQIVEAHLGTVWDQIHREVTT